MIKSTAKKVYFEMVLKIATKKQTFHVQVSYHIKNASDLKNKNGELVCSFRT